MPTVIFVNCYGQSQTVQAPDGGALIKLCDDVDSPVPFHCRRGNCGTCRIAVLDGEDELLPADARERSVLNVFGLSPRTHRLACQVQMRPGPGAVRVSPLGKRAPRPCSLSIPVTLDTVSKQIRVRQDDPRIGDVIITGTSELCAGAVIVLSFHPPSEAKVREVVGRVVRVEPENVDGVLQHYMAVIELLESDEILIGLFQPGSNERA
jgi:ferredoxin